MSQRAGLTSHVVGENCTRLRAQVGMSLRQLADELREQADLAITAQSLSAIERGNTGVTVDLLTALAVVFSVSPSSLLMPHTDDAIEPLVALSGVPNTHPLIMWQWLAGLTPHDSPPEVSRANLEVVKEFRLRSRPSWVSGEPRNPARKSP